MKQEEALRGEAAFGEVFRRGQRLQGTMVRCFFLKKVSAGSRVAVGYSVSSRTANAVYRNRLRRLMREAFRKERSPLLDACSHAGVNLSLLFLFRGMQGVPVRRVALGPVHDDIAAHCRAVIAKL